ncbi:unnamed protein product [Darwinula stevensoni]|uniref:C3H1-type domain-containing protein n=1 Tax=Darwinula stevensoni TaxID=69355 RepID=A0A7R8XA29_9CRUS|nr:unnamed protein product [Darwinula stevensoni]CAG0884928.1 unnamed protein product [Darwinula stevensoni]
MAIAKILESATFMEALEAAGTSLPKKRRRKLSSSAETPPPTVTKPSFKFYQDTLEKDNGEETEKTSDAMEEEEVPETDTSCECISIAESKDHEEEEMDQEEEEEEEEVEELKVKVKEENHLEEDQTAAEGPKDEPGGENHSVATDRKVDLVKSEQGDRLFKLKSVLASAGGSSEKVKKKVSWAEEASLKEVFIFEMDETERVNVNRMKTFGDLMQRERDNEKKAFMKARKQAMGDTMEEQIVWGQLRPLDCPAPPAPPGSKSAEKGVQRARELSVPPATYFQLIQDSPSEPDREYQETKDPRIIPLEDSTAEEKDFTNHPWPAQKGFAPKPAQQSRAIPKGGEWRTSDGRPVAVGDFPPAPQPPPMALGGMMVPPGMMPPPMAGGYPPMMFPGPPGHTLASPMMAMYPVAPDGGPGPGTPGYGGAVYPDEGPPSQNNREREDVCRFFMKTGDCRFGDRCKFLHLVPH